MKYILIFLPVLVFGQINWKPAPSLLVSGYAEGTREIITTKYHKFSDVHDANDKYWNPELSHGNKWKDRNIKNGPAYFGSTTFLVWTTDGKHLLSTIRNVSALSAVMIVSITSQRKRWYYYLLDAILYTASYQLGFHLSYSLVYNGMR